MKKFKFGLERVLNFRKRKTEAALGRFQDQLAKVQKQELHIQNLENQVLEGLRQNQGKVGIGVSPSVLQFNSELVNGLRRKIKLEQARLREMRVELEDRQTVLIKLRRDQKTLELLRERKQAEFKKEVQKREQKLNDDIVVMRQAAKGES